MIGARVFSAMSWILMIFCAWVSDSEPPNTVKSLAKTKTVRPLTVPQPVTTPSPGIFLLFHAEIGAAVLDEHVELLERALVEQQLDALARGQLAAGVLRLDALLAAAELGARRGAARASRGCPSWGGPCVAATSAWRSKPCLACGARRVHCDGRGRQSPVQDGKGRPQGTGPAGQTTVSDTSTLLRVALE